MNPEAVRSKDHVDLTFIFARLQEDGYLTKEDIETLKEIAGRIEEPKLAWLAEDVRYIGEGKFLPNDREFFVTTLDSIRYDIHRIVEEKAEEKGAEIDITEKELLTALPDYVLEVFKVSAREYKEDDTVVREIHAHRAEDEIELNVTDDLDRQIRRVDLNMVGIVRVEADGLVEEIVEETIDELLDEDEFNEPLAYIARHTHCSEFKQETLEGGFKYINRCEIDLKPLKKELSGRKLVDFIDELIETVEREGCWLVTKDPDRIKALCKTDIRHHAYDVYWESARDYAEERLDEEYINHVLPEFKEDWKGFGLKQPITLDCDLTYAYPHGYGFYYYARCKGSKEYDLSLDKIAESYNDIHNTISDFIYHIEETWYY